MTEYHVASRRGWDVIQLGNASLAAEVLPGKGGDVLSLRHVPSGVELMWQTPWGLRARGAATTVEDAQARLMEAYPGGWQSVFPNGGDPVTEHGVRWGMHGDRMGYLTGFDRGHVAIHNPALGLRVALDWDAGVLPHAWYWLEAAGTGGFPWYRGVYVLAIEPSSSFPGQGIAAVRAKTGTQLTFAPGQSRTTAVTLTAAAQ